jgi:hypothetical protein
MEVTEVERPAACRRTSHDGTPDALMVDIGGDFGALIVYTPPCLDGEEIEISLEGHDHRSHNVARRRRTAGGDVFACVFPSLQAGRYQVWDVDGSARTVEIKGGSITELHGPAAQRGASQNVKAAATRSR